MKKVVIKIKEGKVNFDYEGFKGTECISTHENIQKILDKHLSISTVGRQEKEDMYITDDPMQTNKEYA